MRCIATANSSRLSEPDWVMSERSQTCASVASGRPLCMKNGTAACPSSVPLRSVSRPSKKRSALALSAAVTLQSPPAACCAAKPVRCGDRKLAVPGARMPDACGDTGVP